jgi:N-acetylglucosaminyldiphosphoundecaprenol N-acetyl-beta-D-mannosaminyltransferase
MRLKDLTIVESKDALRVIPNGKVLFNTINAHSYNVAQKDEQFAKALMKGDYLIPDGASIVKACRWLKAKSQPKERIAGWDLFAFEMQRLENESADRKDDSRKLKVMFVGSSESVLKKIEKRAALNYPHLDVITLSPPYKREFSDEDISAIIKTINAANPDLLWIGMTAPKQEKLVYQHWHELDIHCHVGTIGAVFDFYAGTVKRAPKSWQDHSSEWLYRFLRNPKRMWRRYLLGNPLFLWHIFMEKFSG